MGLCEATEPGVGEAHLFEFYGCVLGILASNSQ